DLEQELDGLTHVGLGRIRTHAEHDLPGALGQHGRLLRDVRSDDHLHEALLMGLVAHAKRSSIDFAAALVITTDCAATRLSGSTLRASTTSTCGRLRAASQRFRSKSVTTISARSTPRPASLAFSSLVLGAATATSSATSSRSCRNSSENT